MKRMSLKRKLLLFFIIFYAITSFSSLIVGALFEELKSTANWVYIFGAIPFLFQFIYVEITDMKEFERKLFNEKPWKE